MAQQKEKNGEGQKSLSHFLVLRWFVKEQPRSQGIVSEQATAFYPVSD